MRLKHSIDYTEFLQQAQKCEGDVFYETEEGDVLNLKSMLCKFAFVSITNSWDMATYGKIRCELPADYTLLQDYLQED